jgi:molybdopterin-guanine dinucleotide biosynthesis protein B
VTPIVAVSGPSGVGKTRLLTRLIPLLRRRGVVVAVIKHTRHRHAFDVPGKDTDLLRRAGAVAAAIQGPGGLALFGPATGGARELARLLPRCDLILAEGWRREPLPRIEVHREEAEGGRRRRRDPRVFARVGGLAGAGLPPTFHPDRLGPLADLLVARFIRPPPARSRPGRGS